MTTLTSGTDRYAPAIAQAIDRVVDRIEANLLDRTNSDGCWIFTGPVHDGSVPRLSYRAAGRVRKANVRRAVYERHVGPIPKGMGLQHTCQNRLCVNPEHQKTGPAGSQTSAYWEAQRTTRQELAELTQEIKALRREVREIRQALPELPPLLSLT